MATFLITACSNENDEELISTSTKGILSATVEGNHSSTRAGFASDGKFYWSKKDQLGVTTSQNASSFSALSLKNGIGTASGTFDGVINGTIGDYGGLYRLLSATHDWWRWHGAIPQTLHRQRYD